MGIAEVPVQPGRSLLDHILSVYPPGVEMLKDAIRRLARGEPLASTPQSPNEGNYYGFPGTEEFAALAERGFPLYDPAGYVDLLQFWVPGLKAAPSAPDLDANYR